MLRKPLISASRLLEKGHKLVLDETPRIQCKNGDTILLERTGSLFAVRLWIPKGFSQAGLNTNCIMKRKLVRPHTEGRIEKHAMLSGLSLTLPTGSMLTRMSPQTLTDLEER